MKFITLAIIVTSIISCGRREKNECRSRESMRLQCQVVHTPQYGRVWAQEECSRQYAMDRCY